jgi:hypothetical protein
MPEAEVPKIPHSKIIQWCFGSIEIPELDDDLMAAKSALTGVIVSLNNDFAARKADFEQATQKTLPILEYSAIRAEYSDWKRRTNHIKTAVDKRLQQVKAAIHQQEQHRPVGGDPQYLIEKIRWIHGLLDEFLRELDAEGGGGG